MLDSRPKGLGFEPHRRHCVVSLSKNIHPSLVLVQRRKTRPFITERLLMGRKESNQTNKTIAFRFQRIRSLKNIYNIDLWRDGHLDQSNSYKLSFPHTNESQGGTSFADHLCYLCLVFVILSRPFIAALLSPAGKELTTWLVLVMFNCVFVTFLCGILGQVWYLIVSIPDLCRLSYFHMKRVLYWPSDF